MRFDLDFSKWTPVNLEKLLELPLGIPVSIRDGPTEERGYLADIYLRQEESALLLECSDGTFQEIVVRENTIISIPDDEALRDFLADVTQGVKK